MFGRKGSLPPLILKLSSFKNFSSFKNYFFQEERVKILGSLNNVKNIDNNIFIHWNYYCKTSNITVFIFLPR